MSDFKQKLVELGKGEASIADVARALDELVADDPTAAPKAMQWLDEALNAGMPTSVYADLTAHLPPPGDATVFRGAEVTADADKTVMHGGDATLTPGAADADATQMDPADGDATLFRGDTEGSADGADATMMRGAEDATDATRMRTAEDASDATMMRGAETGDATVADIDDATRMRGGDDATLFRGADDTNADVTRMSGRRGDTTGKTSDDATVMHHRSGEVTSAEGAGDDATQVNQDSDKTLFTGDAIDAAFDILSPEAMGAAEDSLHDSEWDTKGPPSEQMLEFREGSVLRNRFILESKLGEGGMGAVWKGVDKLKQEAKDRNPYVAIKLLQGDFREHPEAFIALQRETSKQQRLAHPNIATVYDFDRDDATNTVFMTMEVLSGNDLAAFIRREVPKDGLEYEEAMPLIRQLAAGLAHAHSHELVHSDLKPGNCFVTKENQLKLLDFGIARASKTKSDAEGETTVFDPGDLGALTPAYATIEMFEGRDPDPRDDIYAMAIIAYQLFTGKHPYGKKNAPKAQEAGMTVPPVAKLTKAQNRALERGLAFKREDRTESVEALLEGLEPKRSQTWLWASAAVVILALGAAVGWPIAQNMIAEGEREALIDRIVDPNTMQAALTEAGQMQDKDQRRLVLLDNPRAGDAIEVMLVSGNETTVSQGLELLKLGGADFETAVKSRDTVRNAIVSMYERQYKALFSPANKRYDYQGAREQVTRLRAIYADLADALAVENALVKSKDDLLVELEGRFSQLVEEGKVIPDPDAEDVFDIRDIVTQIAPDYEKILKNGSLPIKARALAAAARDSGDYQRAVDILQASRSYAPDDKQLGILRVEVEDDLQRQRNQLLVSQIEKRLSARDASFTDLAAFQAERDDLIKLAELAPGSPVLDGLRERLTGAFEAAMAERVQNKNWTDAETLLLDYAKLFKLDYLEQQRVRLSTAEASARYQVEMTAERQQAVDERRRALAGLLENPEFSSEWEIAVQVPFKELVALLPAGHPALEPIRAQVADQYIGSAEKALRSDQLVERAKTLLARGEAFYPGYAAFREQRVLVAEVEAKLAAEAAEEERQVRVKTNFDTIVRKSAQGALAAEELAALEKDAREGDAQTVAQAREAVAAVYGETASRVAERAEWGSALDLVNQGLALAPANDALKAQQNQYQGEFDKVRAIEELKAVLKADAALTRADLQQRLAQVKRDFPADYESRHLPEFRRLAAARFQSPSVSSEADLRTRAADLDATAAVFGQALAADARQALDERMATRLAELEKANARNALAYQTLAISLKLVPARGKVASADIRVPDPRVDGGLELVASRKLTAARSVYATIKEEAPRASNLARLESALTSAESRAKEQFARFASFESKRQARRGLKSLQGALSLWVDNEPWKKKLADLNSGKSKNVRGACSPRIAGRGASSRARCWDDVKGARGPTLVVVPAGGAVAKPFAIGQLEVSRNEYNRFCSNGGGCQPLDGDGKLPATGISLDQAEAYARWLSESTGATYRLPTDTEWKHAAEAGGRGAKGKNFNCTVIVGGQTLKGHSLVTTQAGTSNGWGLKNFIGNAREWVKSGGDVATRGGAHTDPMSKCTVSLREPHSGNADAVTGFRLVRELG